MSTSPPPAYKGRYGTRSGESQRVVSQFVCGGGSNGRSVNAFGVPSQSAVAQPVFQASYEVDVFGKTATLGAPKNGKPLSAEAQQAATQVSVSTAVVRLYVQLTALQAQKALAAKTHCAFA